MDLFSMIIGGKLFGGGGSAPVVEPLSVTENGVYTAPSGVDGYSPVTVDVQSGGSGGLELLASTEVTVSTESSSGMVVANLTFDPTKATDKALVAVVRDTVPKRDGYFYASYSVAPSEEVISSSASTAILASKWSAKGWFNYTTGTKGIYLGGSNKRQGTASIRASYSGDAGTIDSTYTVELYAVDI
jgi:hypothetical protein